MTTLTRVVYAGDGITTRFTVPFEKISNDHVVVERNGLEQTLGSDFTFAAEDQVEFINAPSAISNVVIYRDTEKENRLVDFTTGATLTEEELDVSNLQVFYLQQELRDQFTMLLDDTLAALVEGDSIVIENGQTIREAVVASILEDTSILQLRDTLSADQDSISLALDSLAASTAAYISSSDGIQTAQGAAIIALDSRVGTAEGSITSTSAAVTAVTSRLDIAESTLTIQSSAISGLTTSVSDVENDVTAQASSITSLDSRVGAVEGQVVSVASVTARVDSIEVKHGVTLNANGHITGFEQLNDGSTGSFIITTDNFAVVNPGGGVPFSPFNIINGVVTIENAVIKNLNATNIEIGGVVTDSLAPNTTYQSFDVLQRTVPANTNITLTASIVSGSRVVIDVMVFNGTVDNTVWTLERVQGGVTTAIFSEAAAFAGVVTLPIVDTPSVGTVTYRFRSTQPSNLISLRATEFIR